MKQNGSNRFQHFFFSQWNVENKTTKFQLSICLLWKQINTSDPGIINIYSTEKNAQKSSFRTIQYSCQFFRTMRTPKSTLILTLLFSILIPDRMFELHGMHTGKKNPHWIHTKYYTNKKYTHFFDHRQNNKNNDHVKVFRRE